MVKAKLQCFRETQPIKAAKTRRNNKNIVLIYSIKDNEQSAIIRQSALHSRLANQGVNFRDVSTLFKNPESLKEICDEMYEIYKDKGITKIVGIESRGFVMSSALAIRLGAGVVLCRKPGKLPCKTVQESYAKEYGMDTIEIHEDAINENDIILLHDDLLATGGTMKAACNLVKKFHPKKVYANFIIELVNENFEGRKNFDEDVEVSTLLQL